MSVAAKICGLSDAEAIAAAVANGTDYVGFNFYPPSPRSLMPGQAAELAAALPDKVSKVGIFVDPSDADIGAVLAAIDLDLIQLHGKESPAQVADIRSRFARRVIKAVKIELADDLDVADSYGDAADMLLFDAKPDAGDAGALPGGNGVPFDWHLLKGRRWAKPWMLSGGLEIDNVADAIAVSGAQAVDVSSGVERAPGDKDPALVKAFLDVVKAL